MLSPEIGLEESHGDNRRVFLAVPSGKIDTGPFGVSILFWYKPIYATVRYNFLILMLQLTRS